MRTFATPLIIAFVAALAACGKDSTGPRDDIGGSYHLVKVDTTLLPTSVLLDGTARTVTSGTLTILDSTYHFTVCVNGSGATGTSCGAGKLAIIDSGLVWSTNRGFSFVGWSSHASRALVVSGDSVTFQRGDLVAPTLTFVR